MASTLLSSPQVSRKTIAIVLAGSIVTLGPHWRNCISTYVDPLFKRLSEENYSHPLAPMKLVAYGQVNPALIDPVHSVVGHDEEENIVTDRVIMEDSPDNAAFCGYMSVIKIIDDLQTSHPDEEFSFFLWHVAAGPHGSWDPKWDIVCGELMKREVSLSMVLLDDCPTLVQLFSTISPASSRITTWFHTFPDHRFLLSGFMPPGELDVPSVVSAVHPAPSISDPSTTGVTAWDSPSELPAHGTQYPDYQWAAQPFLQHAGSEVYAQAPAIAPFLDLYGSPQASGSAAVQSQPHLNLNNMFVPDTQGLAPMDWPAPPHSSGVEQQQPTPRNYTEKTNSRDDFANANARPMSSGSSDEMSDNEWTGTLNLNGTRVPVRALIAKAVGDLKLSAWPTELEVELAVGLKLSILAIQVWIRENKAPMVRLSYVDGTDNCDFDQLVEKIRAHGYAIVTWENRDRLLLAALGKVILCAAFPEKGTPKRPTSQPPRKVRTLTRKENPQKEKSRQRPRPYPATTSKCSNGPCAELVYPEAAAQNTITLQWPQSEQSQMSATVSSRAECLSPVPALRGMLSVHGEQLAHRRMSTGTAGCMADSSNLNLDAMEDSEMYKYVDFDGYGVQYDSAS